jgi:hypothetical protein
VGNRNQVSRSYVARARYPLWRNVFAPVFVADQLIVMGVLAGLSAIIAGLSRDPVMFLFLAVLAYAAYIFSMQSFLPYSLRIGADDVRRVVDLLDGTRVLARNDERWRWKRKSTLPRWLRSRLDQISIDESGDGYCVCGRKDDMRTLARALNDKIAGD